MSLLQSGNKNNLSTETKKIWLRLDMCVCLCLSVLPVIVNIDVVDHVAPGLIQILEVLPFLSDSSHRRRWHRFRGGRG